MGVAAATYRIQYFNTGLFFNVGFYVRKKAIKIECDMCSSHCGVAEDSNVLVCDTMSLEIWFKVFVVRTSFWTAERLKVQSVRSFE